MEVGQDAPDFEAESSIGKIKLSSYKGKNVILYFYPKAFTSGCTRELQRFVELYNQFSSKNSIIIGVSADSVSSVKKFAEKYGANFPLVADKEKKIINEYGVLSEKGTSAQRVTFIIDESGKVKSVLKNLKKAEDHADKALAIISQ
ncbi:peroxiredoxin [Candidatus Acidianus copahuensis]|uniref:thioredoxin-dependent peroxiredoxin n=1 Tax=Candidatus Acidianus copahuensis TaxID=1160895 RepID=A0A031LJQ6_9CREN|nr:peroxiredoxin [Candidatus Acidianus copahuensis]EZQ01725.1 alkyl hydroperoxide reductase [Candidatus Acidianus copahuensis]NON61454.1 peroxiredoxin [Acidianus sp. RZ1]